ncbi:antigen 5 like allergen Cul n 1 [Drosophila miranda]|uniref:antigen 5 like allergen Cul n 1 n=1 Tax=Drosophila miranda TaxID=7229 RepID=UPI0007E7B36D|nr:antigen 5 like allergen Cul n 1 [Drosophila miranda]
MINGRCYRMICPLFLLSVLFLAAEGFLEEKPTVASKNLCRPDLCSPQMNHVGCIGTKEFAPACGKGNRIIFVNGGLRQSILQSINIMRNYVASGVGNFSVAGRMPTMRWDPTLERLASLLVRQCDMEGKYCANTEKYHYVATTQLSGTMERRSNVARRVVNKLLPTLYHDLLGCHMDKDHRIMPLAEGVCVGHYIPLLQDNGNRMGCAIRYKSDQGGNDTITLTLLCHFSRANVNSNPHYEVATIPGEKCSTGKSKLYAFLCDRIEVVDANNVGDIEETAGF